MTEHLADTPEHNKTLAYIMRRKNMVTADVVDGVTELLEKGDMRIMFSKLWRNRLAGTRHQYARIAHLTQRDEKITTDADTSLPRERAQRDAFLKRPDQGRPSSQLEYWLLTLLSDEEWRDLCVNNKEISDENLKTGALSVQSAIENVIGDEPRTKAFISAVCTAVRDFGSKEVRLFDVGCGAFPVLALAAALESPRAQVTCIEINPLSAKIAQRIVDKLVSAGHIGPKQISIKIGDALTMPLPSPHSIDIVISETFGPGFMHEQAGQILPRYATCLSSKGYTIPSRISLAAVLIPNDQGYSSSTGENKYPLVLNTDGNYIPVMPDEAYFELGERDLTKSQDPVSGSIPIPQHIASLEELKNYTLNVTAELVLDNKGPVTGREKRRILSRNQSWPTSPAIVGFFPVPTELREADPSAYEIRFAYTPGALEKADFRIALVKKNEPPWRS